MTPLTPNPDSPDFPGEGRRIAIHMECSLDFEQIVVGSTPRKLFTGPLTNCPAEATGGRLSASRAQGRA